MALNLQTVKGYIEDARTLLMDRVVPYRYSDVSLLVGLNLALLEGRRLRPDLFVCRYGNDVPSYGAVTGDHVPIEPQFRLAFVYGLVAHAIMRDEEDVQDARAVSFKAMFYDMLTGVRPAPIQGGTPTPQQAKSKGQPQ